MIPKTNEKINFKILLRLCVLIYQEKRKVQQIWITFNLNFCNDTRSTGEIQYHANTRCQSLRKICSSATLGHSLFILYAHAFETLCIRPQERIKDESRGQVSRDAAEESSSRTSLFRNRTQSERTVYVYYRGAGCAMLLTARIQEMHFRTTFLDVVNAGKIFLLMKFEGFMSAGNWNVILERIWKHVAFGYNIIIGMFLIIFFFFWRRWIFCSWKIFVEVEKLLKNNREFFHDF